MGCKMLTPASLQESQSFRKAADNGEDATYRKVTLCAVECACMGVHSITALRGPTPRAPYPVGLSSLCIDHVRGHLKFIISMPRKLLQLL